jgi:hypothetical protein
MKVRPDTTVYGLYIQLHEIRRKIGRIRDYIRTDGISVVSNDVIVSILTLVNEYEKHATAAKMLLWGEVAKPTTAHSMLTRINHVTDTICEYIDDIYDGVLIRRCDEGSGSQSSNGTMSSASYQ